MEVLTTTASTGRPRFIPTEPVVMPSATSTMTRSPISHQQTCNNGQTATSTDTTIRDKTKLLQLAEKVHTRKSSSPNYTKSFRAISSIVSKNGNDLVQTPNVRRTNSTMLSSSSAPLTSAGSRSKVENYKNPKLYASFSSKSSSKLTKALIKSDPAKTNIEHLVNYKSPPKVAEVNTNSNTSGGVIGGGNNVNGKKSPSENGENNHHQHHHHNGSSGGGGGLSSFITPLKALHASFHERSSKLGQTRNKLFSHHRDISSSNAKLLFGTTENLHSSSSSSSEDILTSETIQSSKERKYSAQDLRKQRIERTNNITSKERLQNGSSSVAVPPDFLEGFRNDDSCSTNNNNNNKHHAATNKINGFDTSADRKNRHSEENSNANCMNSFITPDILGGCLDVPKPTLMRNGNNAYRINENDQKLRDELRQVNGTNYSCSPSPQQLTNGQMPDHSNNQAQQVAQQHFNSNSDISQKRKNILVRMSYHDDETSYNDLYRICNNNENGDGQDNNQQYVDGKKLIWPASPITVSTVTPKNHQSTANGASSAKVITSGATNNYCGKDGPNSHAITSSLTNDNANNNSNKKPGPATINGVTSVNSFHCSNGSISNCNNGGGVTQQLHHNHQRPTSSLSCVSNSGVAKSEDKQRNFPQQSNHQKMGRSSSSAEKGQKLVHSQQAREQAEQKTILSRSPEAAGSSTWLQIKNSSTVETVDSLTGAEENDNNNKPFAGVGFKKQIIQNKAVGSTSANACSSALSNLNGKSEVDESNCNGVETDDFSVIVSTIPEGTEEGRGRQRKGLFMEAETSFSHRNVDDEEGGGRFQTALLSDEYAQYLGYDYDSRSSDKVQQTQARLHVLQLGNQVVSAKENGENRGEDENLTMLAIATNAASTTSTSGQSRYGNNGVYQQYHVSQNRANNRGSVSILKPHKSQGHKPILHSVSFRGTDDVEKCFDDGNKSCLGSQSFSKFDRKRSRSLPKSFLSVRNGLRNVLPSPRTRDGLPFERLNDHEFSCPGIVDRKEEESAEEAVKMRWHKLGSSPSPATSSSFSDRRPKSFDYAQRKAWMKLYRDMEVSQATGNSAPRSSRPISKGSITHLHLQETCMHPGSSSNLDGVHDSCRCRNEGDPSSTSTMMRSSDISSTSPSLFKRFSKTFSLRFGSGSNVSKNTGDVHRKGKLKGETGSSPDLLGRLDAEGPRDKVNGKMRKSNVKSVRGDKCQSGDSGIGMDEKEEPRQISNLRRIRSDYISPTAGGVSSYTNRGHPNGSTSTLTKLSLVEIPDHSWDEHNGSPHEGSGSSDTASYEDLVNAKLDMDDQDDGFSSSDEGQTEKLQNPTHYHSLPHRKHKRRLKETESANSCGEAPQEDTSIRGKVVREIIHTEQNYVKTLNDIVQGFLNPCRARNDLFGSKTVQNIFSNIEDILRLHVKFLEALKSQVDPTFVSKSNVGEVFTSWADRFSLYSEYCCNNPISVATVRSLVQFPQYAEFFEACRRLQMMDKLPLHGFLLRPIQRICQYHLQLNELLKHTEESHTDHKSVVEALETMKSVATKINDTQRQFESLQEIIRLQNSIDGWEGPNLVDRNAVILRKGELVKVTHGRKHKEVFVAVLNKDLIYCKKDFMKKSGYVFDGRVDLNLRMWINIDSNEEDEFFGMVHNSWRIYSPERRAWILFTAPSPTEKRKWISALEKTKEEISIDSKLKEMAAVTTALTDSEMMFNTNSHGHHSNTLPKSNKKSKGKHLTVTKVDSDAMLIEVGKLKRTTVYTNPSPSQKERPSSKFYV